MVGLVFEVFLRQIRILKIHDDDNPADEIERHTSWLYCLRWAAVVYVVFGYRRNVSFSKLPIHLYFQFVWSNEIAAFVTNFSFVITRVQRERR